MSLPGSFPVKDNSFPSWLFCSAFPVPYTQVGLLFPCLKRIPKPQEKQRTARVYFCRVLTGSARNRALLKGFYYGSSRVWGDEEEKEGRCCFPMGRLVAGVRLPTQLQGALGAQRQGLKKSNRKNSFGQMRIWTEDVLIFFSEKVALVNFVLYPQLLIKTKWKQHNSLKPMQAFLKWPFHL